MDFRRHIVVFGEAGSGKSEIAINLAIQLARRGEDVALVDLDLIKPFLRSSGALLALSGAHVTLIAPEGKHASSDLPILLPQVRSLFQDLERRIVADVGGSESGMRVIHALKDVIPSDETDFFLVLNSKRPFTDTIEKAVACAKRMLVSPVVKLTGVISNTHLKGETDANMVKEGALFAMEVAERLGIKRILVAGKRKICEELQREGFEMPLLPLDIYISLSFEAKKGRKVGPPFVLR